MQAVILCGGKATRLHPITLKIPKSMIEIEGRPFLEHQLELLKKNKLHDILLCIGDKGDQIKRYFENGEKLGLSINYSSDGKKLRNYWMKLFWSCMAIRICLLIFKKQ